MMNEFEQKKYVAVKEKSELSSAFSAIYDVDAEIESLEQIANSADGTSSHWNNLACLYFEKINFDEAKKCFQRALDVDEHNFTAQQNFGDFLFFQKKYEQAIHFLHRAVEQSSDAGCFERMADSFVALGDVDSAIDAYKNALQLDPKNESLLYKLRLIRTTKSGSSLRLDIPIYSESEAMLVCHFSTTKQKRSVHFKNDGQMALLEKLQNDNLNVTIFHDAPSSPKNSVFHFLKSEAVAAMAHKHLFDVFLSINDADVFNSDIAAITRILCVDNLQNESELNQLTGLCFQGKIDTIIIDRDMQGKFSQRAWQQFENYSIAFADFEKSLFSHIEDSFIQQSLVHIEKFLLTDNPANAKKVLDRAKISYSDLEQFEQKQNFLENRYPHLIDEVAYLDFWEKEGEQTSFNEEIFNHPCYVWLIDQLRRRKDVLKILDVGCHKGEFAVSLANLGYQVSGLDISEYNIKFAETITPPVYSEMGQTEWIRGKAHKLANYFFAEKFDAVLLLQILEHVPDVPRILNQLEQVVKPGGHVFVTVLANPLENLLFEFIAEKTEKGRYLRTFTKEELRTMFRNQHHVKIQEIRDDQKLWFGISFRLAAPKAFVREESSEPSHKTRNRLDDLFHTGCEYAANGHLEKAFEEFMRINDLFPEQGRALYNAGVISDQMGERDSAILLLNKVCEAFPEMVEAFNYLGKIYFLEEDYEEALTFFKNGFSLDESNEITLDNLKMTAAKLGLDLNETELKK